MTKAPQRRAAPIGAIAEPARSALTVRLRKEVRRDIEEAAIKYGRSLSEEVESRLESSLAFKQYIKTEWGDDVFKIAQALANSLSFIENIEGAEWTVSDRAAELLCLTASQIIRNYRDIIIKAPGSAVPEGAFDDKSPKELAQMFAALGGLAPPRPKPKATLLIDDEDVGG